MSEIFIGRQPIYNTHLGIYGYELLFRSGRENVAALDSVSQDGATSTTIINTFFEMGLENLVGNRHAFLNLTERFLTYEDSLPIPPTNIVLEVLEIYLLPIRSSQAWHTSRNRGLESHSTTISTILRINRY